MKDLALDLWHDLRQRRLLPVAIVLGIALVAVPIVLLKGEPEAQQPPLRKQDSSKAAMPVVNEDASSLAGSSKLGIFDRKNPFRSLASLPESAQSSAGGATAGSAAGVAGGAGDDLALGGGAGAASGDDPLAPGGGSGGGSASSDPAAAAPSSGDGGGTSAPPSGSDGSGSGGSERRPSPADLRFYQYVVEVDFGRVDREERYRDVRALDMLPDESDPVVVYLGQTRDNESSFLINQRFKHGAEGKKSEGTCVPSTGDCNFIYLRTDNRQDDHYFTEREGKRKFHLKLIAVKRKLDTRDASRSGAESTEVQTRVRGAKSTRTTAFDFRIPLIVGQRR